VRSEPRKVVLVVRLTQEPVPRLYEQAPSSKELQQDVSTSVLDSMDRAPRMRSGWRFVRAACFTACAALLLTSTASSRPTLATATVEITSAGPSPTSLSLPATLVAPSWLNRDDVEHTVRFTNGRCSLVLAPGDRSACGTPFWRYVGSYDYVVSGVPEGSGQLVVRPLRRRVAISASRLLVTPGQRVEIRGILTYETLLPGPTGQAVTIKRQVRRSGKYVTIAKVRTVLSSQDGTIATYRWRMLLFPQVTARYRAVALTQPSQGQVWRNALTRSIEVRVAQ
jgi:hypothetical protein